MTNQTKTTSEDLIIALTAELERVGAGQNGEGLLVCPTEDFTVLDVCDNQETTKISIDTAISWYDRLQKLADSEDSAEAFESAWQALTEIPNYEFKA